MNSTTAIPYDIQDYYIICSLSVMFASAAVLISVLILILVPMTKPRLHTVRHLLMCNTCIASIFYCIIQTMNYIFLIFFPSITSVMFCRWRAYLAYMTCCAVVYSFFIQAVSRLFISVFSKKYKSLVTFKTHYILIAIKWCSVIIMPLPSIITNDITFIPYRLCWVQLTHLIHIIYAFVFYYLIPTFSICLIYAYIYSEIKKTKPVTGNLLRLIHGEKRDVELLRNILILLTIYFMGGFPILLYLLSSNKIFYFASIVSVSLAVAVEKLCTILLDQELRRIVGQLCTRIKRVAPTKNLNRVERSQNNIAQIQGAIGYDMANVQKS